MFYVFLFFSSLFLPFSWFLFSFIFVFFYSFFSSLSFIFSFALSFPLYPFLFSFCLLFSLFSFSLFFFSLSSVDDKLWVVYLRLFIRCVHWLNHLILTRLLFPLNFHSSDSSNLFAHQIFNPFTSPQRVYSIYLRPVYFSGEYSSIHPFYVFKLSNTHSHIPPVTSSFSHTQIHSLTCSYINSLTEDS